MNNYLFALSFQEKAFIKQIERLGYTEEELLDITKGRAMGSLDPLQLGVDHESTMDGAKRARLGSHYTSPENMEKVVGPLFLNEMRSMAASDDIETLIGLLDSIEGLRFFDPCCGTGNFLVYSYIEIAKVEDIAINKLWREGHRYTPHLAQNQFYGMDVDRKAALTAILGLSVAAYNMGRGDESAANVTNECSLSNEWPAVDYIFGNPPFKGGLNMSAAQKSTMEPVMDGIKNWRTLDFVSAWFKKAADYMSESLLTECAFVATKSICQGTQAPILWDYILKDRKMRIDFAYRPFKWGNASEKIAQVTVVVIGFSPGLVNASKKPLVDEGGNVTMVDYISPYLTTSKVVYTRRLDPISPDVKKAICGTSLYDGGEYTFDDAETAIQREILGGASLIELVGGKEVTRGITRHTINSGAGWDTLPPGAARLLQDKAAKVKECRLGSNSESVRKLARTPLNANISRLDVGTHLIWSRVSSENRDIVPMRFYDGPVAITSAVHAVPNATVYDFAILTSRMHMAFMRNTSTRMKTDYRYNASITYNNFVWPSPSADQRIEIEGLAQNILNVRETLSHLSLGDMYLAKSMPEELRQAHNELDIAIDAAYGYSGDRTDESRMEFLGELYTKAIEEENLKKV